MLPEWNRSSRLKHSPKLKRFLIGKERWKYTLLTQYNNISRETVDEASNQLKKVRMIIDIER